MNMVKLNSDIKFLKRFKNISYFYPYKVVHIVDPIYFNWLVWYDKNNARTKKIAVDLFSVYRDISSKTNNFKISKFLLSKKLNLKLGSILAQTSTYNSEAV